MQNNPKNSDALNFYDNVIKSMNEYGVVSVQKLPERVQQFGPKTFRTLETYLFLTGLIEDFDLNSILSSNKIKLYHALVLNVNELTTLSVRAYNKLRDFVDSKGKEMHELFLSDIVAETEASLLKRKFGRKTINELKEILENEGLKYGMNFEKLGINISLLERLQEQKLKQISQLIVQN